jgi:four helix bundle protein
MDGDKQGTGSRELKLGPELRRGSDIAERLLRLGAAALSLARKLPRDVGGRHVASQLVRSATSAGANYGEARAAESRADFIHKVRVSAKEMHETIYWLRLVERASLVPSVGSARVDAMVGEANELAAILTASARTARQNGS